MIEQENILEEILLIEELHHELNDILDNNNYSLDTKNHLMTKKIRQLGEESGVAGHSKGSSRVFFKHTQPHTITLDGKQVNVPVGTKVAKRFNLDRYTGQHRLIGQDQNEAEEEASNMYGMFHKHPDGSFTTRHEGGIVAPTLDSHKDHHHITALAVHPFDHKEFTELTKNEDFPKGMKFKDFQHALMAEHSAANGRGFRLSHTKASQEALEHPLTQEFNNHMFDTGHHPGDIRPSNMGIFEHPITGKKKPVLLDSGYNYHTGSLYQKAREKKRQIDRGY